MMPHPRDRCNLGTFISFLHKLQLSLRCGIIIIIFFYLIFFLNVCMCVCLYFEHILLIVIHLVVAWRHIALG